jgi:hypothetical protein
VTKGNSLQLQLEVQQYTRKVPAGRQNEWMPGDIPRLEILSSLPGLSPFLGNPQLKLWAIACRPYRD